MELIDITRELYDASQRLHKGSSQLFLLAKEKAEAEREYRKQLQMQIVDQRQQGMPATLISDIARGICADKKFERDLAEAKYVSGRDSLDAIATQISALQTILKYQFDVSK